LPVSAPKAARIGPPTTGAISGGLVSSRSKTCGKRSPIVSGIAGWKTSPEWAASWWATKTTVRWASAGPISAITLKVCRRGSNLRSRRLPGGKSSAIAAAPAAPSASPRARLPRSAAIPPSAPAAAPIPSGHQ
jgi:hypothetical protein